MILIKEKEKEELTRWIEFEAARDDSSENRTDAAVRCG